MRLTYDWFPLRERALNIGSRWSHVIGRFTTSPATRVEIVEHRFGLPALWYVTFGTAADRPTAVRLIRHVEGSTPWALLARASVKAKEAATATFGPSHCAFAMMPLRLLASTGLL